MKIVLKTNAIKANQNCIVNHKGEEHEKQIVSDSIYTHNDHYLKLCILRSIVLTIQKVCIGSTFYKYRVDIVVKTL